MGFSVTAAHSVLLIAALGAGGAFAGAFLSAAEEEALGEARADDTTLRARETRLTIVENANFPNFNNGANRFKVQIVNDGTVPVEVSKLTHVIGGTVVLTATIEKDEVASNTASDLLLPGDTLEVWFRPITQSPTRYLVVTADGAAAQWVS